MTGRLSLLSERDSVHMTVTSSLVYFVVISATNRRPTTRRRNVLRSGAIWVVMSDNETIEIIVHGPRCPNWPDPQTAEEWLAAQLVKDEVEPGDWDGGQPEAEGVWRCLFCKQAIFIFLVGPDIDFGMEPSLGATDEKIGAFIETFEGVANPLQ